MKLAFNPFRSVTMGGVLGTMAQYLLNAYDPSMIPAKLQPLGYALTAVLASLGMRNAVAKSGPPK